MINEEHLAERFAAVASTDDDSDWTDVCHRARNDRRRSTVSLVKSRTRRQLAVALLVAVAMIGTGVTVAATDWGIGEPAPRAVERDFAAYPSEVGLEPMPEGAFLAARDGADYALYATQNRQGGYCLTVRAPWRDPAKLRGGGTCVTRDDAGEPIAVGVVAAGASEPTTGLATHLVAGRVLDPRAERIRFTTIEGDEVERRLGAAGFFLAALQVAPCPPNQSWNPVFLAFDAEGQELARARITVMAADRTAGCGFEVSPHGPYKFDKQ